MVRSQAPLALLPVQVTEAVPVTEAAPSKRGEPVAVYLRSRHIPRPTFTFDEEAFARVVSVLEGV